MADDTDQPDTTQDDAAPAAPAPLMSAPPTTGAAPMAAPYPSWIGKVNVNPQPATKPAMWNTVVQNAATAGVDPDVMWRMFGSERSYQDKPNPFQIMPNTVLGLRRAYPSQNFGDPNDPVEGARMAPWLLRSSNAGLTAALGHEPNGIEQYMGWVFGPKAVNVLKADPNTPISQVLPQDWIDRNPNRSKGPDGMPITPVTTAGDLRWWIARRMGYDNPYSTKDVGDASDMPKSFDPAPEAPQPQQKPAMDFSDPKGSWMAGITPLRDSSGPVTFDHVAAPVRQGLYALHQQFGDFSVSSATGGGHDEGSYHYRGMAIDVPTAGWSQEKIADFIVKAHQSGFTGIGIDDRHIHIDTRATPLVFKDDHYTGPVGGLDPAGWTAKLASVKQGQNLGDQPSSVSLATSSPLMPPTDRERAQRDAANYERGYGLAGGIWETASNDTLTAQGLKGLYNSSIFGPQADPNFHATPEMITSDKRLQDIPEPWQESLIGSTSHDDYEARVAALQERQDVQSKIAAMGGKGTLASVIGNLMDPAGLAVGAIPMAGGAYDAALLSKVLWGMGTGAAGGFLTEATKGAVDPTWEKDSLLRGVAFGALMGGVVGPWAHVNPAIGPEANTLKSSLKGVVDTLDTRYKTGQPEPKAPISTKPLSAVELEGGQPTSYGAPIPTTYLDPHGFETMVINRMNEIEPEAVQAATDLDNRIGVAQANLAHLESNPPVALPEAGRAARVSARAAELDPETMGEATRLDSAVAAARQKIADNEATKGHMLSNETEQWLTKAERDRLTQVNEELGALTGKRRSSPKAKALKAELEDLGKKALAAQEEALTRYGAETQGLRSQIADMQGQRGQLGPKVKSVMDAAHAEEAARETTQAQAAEAHEVAKATLRGKIDKWTTARERLAPKIEAAEKSARADMEKLNIRPLEDDNVMSTTHHLPKTEAEEATEAAYQDAHDAWATKRRGLADNSDELKASKAKVDQALEARTKVQDERAAIRDAIRADGSDPETDPRWLEYRQRFEKADSEYTRLHGEHRELSERIMGGAGPRPERQGQVAEPPKDSSVGAAANSGVVAPVGPEALVDSWLSGLTQQTYNKAKFAYGRLRAKLTNVGAFRASDSPVEVALGTHGMADRVGNADHSALPLNTASEEMTHGMHAVMAQLASRTKAAFNQWAKAKGLNWLDRLKQESTFKQLVSDAIAERDPNIRAQMDPHVLRAADAHSKFYGDYWELMQDPGLRDGSQREPLQGAAGVPKDASYLPHLWDFRKFQDMLTRLGDSGMQQLLRHAITSRFGTQYTTEALDKMTKALFTGLKEHTFGQDMSLSRVLSGDDKGGLAALLRGHGVDSDVVDDILGRLAKPDEKGKIGRLKQRTPYDEKATINLLDHSDGQVKPFRVKDMLDWDSMSVAQKYSRQMEGHLALARLRVANPMFDPDLHGPGKVAEGAVPENLIDGLETDAKWQKLQDVWKSVNGTLGIDRNVTQARIKHFEMIRNKIAGIPDEFEHTKAAASLRILQNYNLSRVLNQVGFMHIPQAWQAMSQMGLKAALKSMPWLRAFWRDAQSGQLKDELSAMIEQSTGIGSDFLRGSIGPNVHDSWTNAVSSPWESAEKMSGKLARYTTVIGGLAPMITSLQRWSARAAMVRFAQDAAGEAHGLFGQTGLNANRLAALGIEPKMQARIQQALRNDGIAKGNTGPKALANLKCDGWDPEVAHAFWTAITRWTNKAMQENDLGQMNMIFDKRFGKLLTQFRSFVFGSFENNTLHNLHMRDQEAVSNVLGSSVMGALSYIAQTHTQALGRADKEDFLQKRLDFEHVAAAAVVRGGWASFIPAMVDTALMYGDHDPVFDERSSGQSNGGLLSIPAAGLFSSLQGTSQAIIGHAFKGEPISRRDVTNFRSILPGGNWPPVVYAANRISQGLPTGNTHLGAKHH